MNSKKASALLETLHSKKGVHSKGINIKTHASRLRSLALGSSCSKKRGKKVLGLKLKKPSIEKELMLKGPSFAEAEQETTAVADNKTSCMEKMIPGK